MKADRACLVTLASRLESMEAQQRAIVQRLYSKVCLMACAGFPMNLCFGVVVHRTVPQVTVSHPGSSRIPQARYVSLPCVLSPDPKDGMTVRFGAGTSAPFQATDCEVGGEQDLVELVVSLAYGLCCLHLGLLSGARHFYYLAQ